jgi:hypothetical protein
MRRKGVLYDVGRVLWVNWRPVFDPAVVRRELQIIRDDLHCNAVKICGRDISRLTVAAETALELDLEVWFSPELWDQGPGDTLAHIVAAAEAAEQLRRGRPERLVFQRGHGVNVVHARHHLGPHVPAAAGQRTP